jgi:hypothetical protein
MLRTLNPSLISALLVAVAAGAAYGLGGPAWIVYAAILMIALILIPGVDRWDQRRHPPGDHPRS